MIEYLLDTNVCIDLINGKSVLVRQRFKRALVERSVVGVSMLAVYELWYGVAKSKKRDFNTDRVKAFLAGPIHMIDFDAADARAAGEVRALLEHEKRSIGAYDSLIAGQAVRRGFTLVTANTREFARVDDLNWVDWSR